MAQPSSHPQFQIWVERPDHRSLHDYQFPQVPEVDPGTRVHKTRSSVRTIMWFSESLFIRSPLAPLRLENSFTAREQNDPGAGTVPRQPLSDESQHVCVFHQLVRIDHQEVELRAHGQYCSRIRLEKSENSHTIGREPKIHACSNILAVRPSSIAATILQVGFKKECQVGNAANCKCRGPIRYTPRTTSRAKAVKI